MNHYLENTETVMQGLHTNEAGLSREEAAKRLIENGRNELAKAKKKKPPLQASRFPRRK